MMLFIKKVNFIIYLAVAIAVGFGFGCLVRSNSIQDDLLAADVAKASLYNNQKEDPEVTVVEEMLRNDTAFLSSTQSAISVLKDRMTLLNGLTEKTLEVCAELPEFKDLELTLTSLQAKAHNTNLAVESAENGLKKVLSGKSAPEYETASNNMYIGYQKIQSQLEVGKTFVDLARTFVENNEGENVEQISELIAEWSLYCVQDAALNDSQNELAYWGVKVDELSTTEKLASNEVLGALSQAYIPFKSNARNLSAHDRANLMTCNASFNFKHSSNANFKNHAVNLKSNANESLMQNHAVNFMRHQARPLMNSLNPSYTTLGVVAVK